MIIYASVVEPVKLIFLTMATVQYPFFNSRAFRENSALSFFFTLLHCISSTEGPLVQEADAHHRSLMTGSQKRPEIMRLGADFRKISAASLSIPFPRFPSRFQDGGGTAAVRISLARIPLRRIPDRTRRNRVCRFGPARSPLRTSDRVQASHKAGIRANARSLTVRKLRGSPRSRHEPSDHAVRECGCPL